MTLCFCGAQTGERFPLQGEAALSHRSHLRHSHHAVQGDHQGHVLAAGERLHSRSTYKLVTVTPR